MGNFMVLEPRNGFKPSAHAARPWGMYSMNDVSEGETTIPGLAWGAQDDSGGIVVGKSWKVTAWECSSGAPFSNGGKKTFKRSRNARLSHVTRIILRYQMQLMAGHRISLIPFQYPNCGTFKTFAIIDGIDDLEEFIEYLNGIDSDPKMVDIRQKIRSRSGKFHVTVSLRAITIYDDNTYDIHVGNPIGYMKQFGIRPGDEEIIRRK